MTEPTAGIRLLLIDDHRAYAEGLARLIADEPDVSVVGVAASGGEGLALVEREKPTVVVVEYALPDQDGVAVTAEIKRRQPEVMVVMLTGSADDSVLLEAIEAGCSGFLTKDRDASEVVDAIRGVAAGEARISPVLLARLLPQFSRSRRSTYTQLTDREREVLIAVAACHPTKTIATDLFLSVYTVRNYVQSILNKLDAHTKLEAVTNAVREGLIEFPE
jgi:two-component system response regulator DevR